MSTQNATVDQEWFKEYLESKFEHFETKNKHIETKLDQILTQTTKTNGRVDVLMAWKEKTGGIWYGINKVSVAVAAILGVIISALLEWFLISPNKE